MQSNVITTGPARWFETGNVNLKGARPSKNKEASINRGLIYHRKVFRRFKQDYGKSPLLVKIEPWLRHSASGQLCQPDVVLIDIVSSTALVIEAKLNWRDDRDAKLLATYLPAVKDAYRLLDVRAAMCVSHIQDFPGEPLWAPEQLWDDTLGWKAGDPTPVLLYP